VGQRDWPKQLDDRIAAVAAASNPYEESSFVLGCAVDYLLTSITASRLYQVWAALQDWFDLNVAERPEALAAMRRAASEWVAVKDDPLSRDTYLDHWQYDVLGYKRPDHLA
jgi:hypothetical protein